MKKLNIDVKNIPLHNIVFVATSIPDYEMDRAVFVENYPTFGDYVLVTGDHCSCFGFDEVEWESIQYDKQEILELMKVWTYGAEAIIAPLITNYLQNE